MTVHSRKLQTPIPPNASFGYGTAVLAVPGKLEVLLGWIEGGASYRLARWELTTGKWEKIPTLGLPRDAVFDRAGHARVLCTLGLHEAKLAPHASVKKITQSIPEYPAHFWPLPGSKDVLLSVRRGKTWLRVASNGKTRRVSAPAPDVLFKRGKDLFGLSFERGVGYRIDEPSKKLELPLAAAAIVVGGKIYVAPGGIGPSRNVAVPMQTKDVFDIENQGAIVELGRDFSLGSTVIDLKKPILKFFGPTEAGLVLTKADDVLFWIDLAKKRVIAKKRIARQTPYIIGDVALLLPSEPGDPALALGVGAKAKRVIETFVPAKREAPSPAAVARKSAAKEAGIIERELFKNVRLKGTLGPAHFRNCEFQYCSVNDLENVSEVEGVTLERCIIHGGHLLNVRLVDCRFERVNLRYGPHFFNGIDFLRVVLVGPFDSTLVFQNFPAAMLARTGADEWALDISQADFKGIELRGLPSRFVRRNPETQCVVRRERLLDGRWQKLREHAFSYRLKYQLKDGDDERILVACRRGRDFADEIAAIKLLRKERVAEPD